MNFKKRVNGSWTDTPHYIHNTSTDTLTTLPAELYPNAETATVGLKGQAVQSSVPSPTSPVMPQGTGERTGNLAKYWKAAYVTASGAVNANRVNGVSFPVKLEAGQTVSFTNQKANFGRGIAIFSEFDGETLTNMIYRSTNNTVTYTADSDCYVIIWGNYDNTTSMDEAVFNLCCQMLNTGSTALPYEPYGYKIPISSASTTTPIYLGEVETTRRVKKFVLTGEETLTSGSVIGQIRTPLTGAIDSLGLCTHYILKTSYGGAFPYIRIRSNTLWFEISPDGYETKEEALTAFKSYLSAQYAAGTPVTLWYVLATPETAVVNEPLMKIGDYADTVSGITIPVTAGGDTISVGTTVQPSEVSVNYHGWHPVQNVHERDNGAWTE